jgi:hypothetical protein
MKGDEVRPSIHDTHLVVGQCFSEVLRSYETDLVGSQVKVRECLSCEMRRVMECVTIDETHLIVG